MHPVELTTGEVELLKAARKKYEWRDLPSYKLKYLFQRMVAMPKGDLQTVIDIANDARLRQGKPILKSVTAMTRELESLLLRVDKAESWLEDPKNDSDPNYEKYMIEFDKMKKRTAYLRQEIKDQLEMRKKENESITPGLSNKEILKHLI